MIYPNNFEQKIGFDQVRQLLKGKCLSTLGEEKVDDMVFSDHLADIGERLDQTAEFVHILQEEDGFPAQYFFDVRPSLLRIRVEGICAARWRPYATSCASCSVTTRARRPPTPAWHALRATSWCFPNSSRR